jgi:hypothetical protein
VNLAVEGSSPSGHPKRRWQSGNAAVRKTVASASVVQIHPGALHVPVAQQDSARGSEPRGRPFESGRGCHGAGLAGREVVRKTAGRVQLPPRLQTARGPTDRAAVSLNRECALDSRRADLRCSRLWTTSNQGATRTSLTSVLPKSRPASRGSARPSCMSSAPQCCRPVPESRYRAPGLSPASRNR